MNTVGTVTTTDNYSAATNAFWRCGELVLLRSAVVRSHCGATLPARHSARSPPSGRAGGNRGWAPPRLTSGCVATSRRSSPATVRYPPLTLPATSPSSGDFGLAAPTQVRVVPCLLLAISLHALSNRPRACLPGGGTAAGRLWAGLRGIDRVRRPPEPGR